MANEPRSTVDETDKTPGLRQNGTPDASFGGDGIALVALPGGGGVAFRAVAVRPDGRIIATGNATAGGSGVVARFDPDGTPDAAFGGTGLVFTGAIDPFAVAVQPDGRVVVGGAYNAPNYLRWFGTARFNPDGTLDPSFDGDGKVFTTAPDASVMEGNDMALQADGKVVVAGGVLFPGGSRSLVVRYNTDGSLDPTFTSAVGQLAPGIINTDLVPGDNDGYLGVAIRPDGRIVAAGQAGSSGRDWFFASAGDRADGVADADFTNDLG